MIIKEWLLVGIGGFIGSVMRHSVSMAMKHWWAYKPWFPWGTLTVNIVGCLLIGFIGGLAEYEGIISRELRLLVMVGFLGGFTTFSSFGYDSVLLAHETGFFRSGIYIFLNLAGGIAGVLLGMKLALLKA